MSGCRNPVGMHEAGLSKFTHYLRGKLSAASKENLKQALDTPPGDKGEQTFGHCQRASFFNLLTFIRTYF